MNAVIGFILAVLVYPGVLIAILAGWALLWVRESASGAMNGVPLSNPLRGLAELRATFERESAVTEGEQPALVAAASMAAMIFPLLALVLLPVPGNPLLTTLGLTGDLA